jgi:hypothetical protein
MPTETHPQWKNFANAIAATLGDTFKEVLAAASSKPQSEVPAAAPAPVPEGSKKRKFKKTKAKEDELEWEDEAPAGAPVLPKASTRARQTPLPFSKADQKKMPEAPAGAQAPDLTSVEPSGGAAATINSMGLRSMSNISIEKWHNSAPLSASQSKKFKKHMLLLESTLEAVEEELKSVHITRLRTICISWGADPSKLGKLSAHSLNIIIAACASLS